MNFNLLDEEFIPVIWSDGRVGRVGIRTALAKAARIRQIAASNPMDNVALLRFLLAVLYWCQGPPPSQDDKDRILADGQFPPDWFKKLDQHKDCFNLLGAGKRFYQNPAYKNKEPQHTTNYLIHEVPSGTNKWHFRHSTDMLDGLCPTCCAMGLIRLPVFATSAGKGMSPSTGKSPGLNSKPPLYVLPMGRTLAATLALSWTVTKCDLGTPEWETPANKLPCGGLVPLLAGLTWLPRSVWLANPEEPESACVSCGRRDRLIRRCVFDGKGSMKSSNCTWRDPHVVYQVAKDDKEAPLQTSNALGARDAAAGRWANDTCGILRAQQPFGNGFLWCVGFSTEKNDKYLETAERTIVPFPPAQQGKESFAFLPQWEKEGFSLARKMRPKGSKHDHDEIRSAVDSIRPHVESRVSANIADLLAEPESAWPRAIDEYRRLLPVIAKSLAPGFTSRAVRRRNEIAGALPDMTPRQEPEPRKPKAKKGGDK
jgi:hypothetical protein